MEKGNFQPLSPCCTKTPAQISMKVGLRYITLSPGKNYNSFLCDQLDVFL